MSRAEETPPAVAAIGRFLQICVYAPIGAGAKLVDDAPGALARARQELSNARFIGRMVVSQAEAQLRDRLGTEPSTTSARDLSDAPDPVDEGPSEVTDDRPAAEIEVDVDAVDHEVVDHAEGLDVDEVDTLAVPDYDDLPAIDIIAQLESLDADELARIDAYERSHRRRRTVLGKIDQLRTSS